VVAGEPGAVGLGAGEPVAGGGGVAAELFAGLSTRRAC
jgi:hypothetical protein